MQFLNPLVLLALAAAAVPLLLHLLQKRKLRPIEFSTLRFLKELQKTTVRAIKLRQILLLILRTLIILFIVLAFARPALKGSFGSFGTHAHSTVVILLDNSMSMEARDAHGGVFAEAQHAAAQIAGMLEEGDNAALVTLAAIGDTPPQPTHDFTQLERTIAAAHVAPHSANIEEGMRIASTILGASKNPNKEVFLITDEQQCSFDTSSAARLTLFDDRTEIFVIHAGADGRHDGNLSVDSLHIETAVFEQGKPVDATAYIKNNGNAAVDAATVHLFQNGKNAAQRVVSIPAHAITTAILSAPLDRTGFVSFAATVEDDAIETDNARYAALLVPGKIRVALISQTPEETQFVKLALAPGGMAENGIQLSDVPASKIDGLNFSSYDVLFFTALPQLSSSGAQRFHEYLAQGGGAVIFAGGGVDAYNSTASITTLPAMTKETGGTAAAVFGNFDESHPLFQGVFQHAQSQRMNAVVAESPKIATYMRMADCPALQPIIRLANGAPFLAQQNIGEGVALLCAVPPTSAWSDLPYKTLFVPLVTRSILYTGAQEIIGASQTAEEPFDLVLRKRQNIPASAVVRAPDGTETKILAIARPASSILPIGPQEQCGVYTVSAEDGTAIASFAVNPESKESDLRALSDADVEKNLRRLLSPQNRVVFVNADDNIVGQITRARFGVELWKYCVIAALLCAIAEMFVARAYKREMPEN